MKTAGCCLTRFQIESDEDEPPARLLPLNPLKKSRERAF